MKILFSDFLDDSGGISRESAVADTEAGVAYIKLKSVYPSKTKEIFARTSPESLAEEPAVRDVLGSININLKQSVCGNTWLWSVLVHCACMFGVLRCAEAAQGEPSRINANRI